ncbi:MAG TPA: nuclear transport factor 2 family protein [Firmicutes bacterium]|nr:nuclear transport factor 2 family protein [Bacillota bacterium]
MKMKRWAWAALAVVLAVSLVGCGEAPMTDSAKVEQTVRNLAQALVDGNAARAAELSNGTVDYWKTIFALADFTGYKVDNLVITISGSQATAVFMATVETVVLGRPQTDVTAITWRLFKSGDQWKVDVMS